MDWRLAIGSVLVLAVLGTVVYGLLLGAERYQAEADVARAAAESNDVLRPEAGRVGGG